LHLRSLGYSDSVDYRSVRARTNNRKPLLLAALDHPAARNQVIPIGGPEPLSWRDMVSTAEQELGWSIPIETPVGERLPGLPDFVTDLMTVLEMYDSPLDMRETASIYGSNPRQPRPSFGKHSRRRRRSKPRVATIPGHRCARLAHRASRGHANAWRVQPRAASAGSAPRPTNFRRLIEL
jgi:hypothetical protein